MARFSGLAPEVVLVAKAASVAGTRFWPQLVSAMTGTSDAEVSSALGALINAGLARAQDDGEVEFAHPLFAQALYESVERPERSRLHAAALRGLLAMGAEPAKAAVHAQLGHLVGDQTAIDVLERAGRAALAAGALEGAVNYLAAAVELAGNLVAPTLLLELAEAELATGRTEAGQGDLPSRPRARPGHGRPGGCPGDAGQGRVQRSMTTKLRAGQKRSGPPRGARSWSGCWRKR